MSESKIEPGDLQSYSELVTQANVTVEDIKEAIAEWQDNPPEEKYKTILETEIVEEN